MIRSCTLAEGVAEFIIAESVRLDPLEAGGLLIGRFDADRVLVTHATDSGPRAVHSPAEFRRDGEYSQMVLDQIVAESSQAFDYIGEWHSHPANVGPSYMDLTAMQWIARTKKYAVANPMLALCVKENSDRWVLRFHILRNNFLVRLSIQEPIDSGGSL